jgi:hypothetical protein
MAIIRNNYGRSFRPVHWLALVWVILLLLGLCTALCLLDIPHWPMWR